jgi:putative lipoic acid-binding regulatory protein
MVQSTAATLFVLVFSLMAPYGAEAFSTILSFPSSAATTVRTCRTSQCSSNSDDEDDIVARATVRMDDGGSDLTDRFKYKVNALMGVFDPLTGDDTEHVDGNILNALLNFPVRYTFHVVGKTNDETDKELFVESVKTVVQQSSGDAAISCQVTPRSKTFTKVTVEAQVDSAAIIATIYKDLEALEQSIMQF